MRGNIRQRKPWIPRKSIQLGITEGRNSRSWTRLTNCIDGTVLMELWELQDKHQILLTSDRVGFRSDWSLVFQRSDGTSNVGEADLFDSSAAHWAACWLCFYGIGVFDSTFSTPPRLPPPPANVFSHSICSTVTGGVMPLPFLLLVRRLTRSVDKWNYRPWKCNVYAEQI